MAGHREPYYEEEGIVIYHGDCREILPNLRSVDLVVTDPMYGVGVSFGDRSTDTHLAFEENVVMLASLSWPTAFTVPSTKLFDVPRPQWIGVWYKPLSLGFWNSPLYPHWEAICFYRIEKLSHADVWVFNPEKLAGHPTVKPLKLWTSLLDVMPKGTVLDPFMGSGTTLVAAKQLGRKAIGIEIEKKYCDIAIERLRQGVLPLR